MDPEFPDRRASGRALAPQLADDEVRTLVAAADRRELRAAPGSYDHGATNSQPGGRLLAAPNRRQNAMPTHKQKTENQPETVKSVMASVEFPIAVSVFAVQAWMDLGTEAARFALQRLRQNIESQQSFMACTSLKELQSLQAEFVASAQAQYATEAGRMLKLIGNVAATGLAGTAKARNYDDVPL